MKKQVFALILLLFSIIFLLSSCQNWRVKQAGGSMTIELKPNEKMINATWKDNDLWYLTKPMSKTDSAETYILREKSNRGILEGKITFIETKR
jgi:hypothetical protein